MGYMFQAIWSVRVCQSQVDVLKTEKEVLEETAANANAKVQENREAMAAQTKQLGQLQYLPPRLQDMQEQVACQKWLESVCICNAVKRRVSVRECFAPGSAHGANN